MRDNPPHDPTLLGLSPDEDVTAGVADNASTSRRMFLLTGLGVVLTGCAQDKATEAVTGPTWDPTVAPTPPQPRVATGTPSSPPGTATRPAVLPRSMWATGDPVPTLMNRMVPIRYVTIHHDGMKPFYGTTQGAAAARLDAIRRSHRGRGWGDIGYHYAIDRAGNVWEARPLRYQGAHVKNYNPGNVGIVVLGNFDQQQPSQQQLTALQQHTSSLMRAYDVRVTNLRTHMQWAPTRCPGRHLQRYVESATSNGAFG